MSRWSDVKMNKIKEKNLLEDLTQLGNLDYISNLKLDNAWKGLLLQLEEKESYSVQQWEESIYYLTGKKVKFKSYEELYQYLLDIVE